MKVKIQFLDTQVKMLSQATDYLNEARDNIQGEKTDAEMRNQDLKDQVRAQEEIANKRLQNKLNRDKNPEIKELLAQEELINAHNEDIYNKLREEKEKFDKLQNENMEIGEQLALKKAQFAEDTDVVAAQDEELAKLRAEIEGEQTVVDQLHTDLIAARKLREAESETNRWRQVNHAALTRKTIFIEENYDYTSQVHKMSHELFRSLI